MDLVSLFVGFFLAIVWGWAQGVGLFLLFAVPVMIMWCALTYTSYRLIMRLHDFWRGRCIVE